MKIKTRVFSLILICSFMWWLISIFVGGVDNNQFSVFFLKVGDFFADTLNVIRYSSERDPYFHIYNGPQEKPYPALTYCIMYLFSRISVIPEDYRQLYFQPQLLIVLMIFVIISFIALYELIKMQIKSDEVTKQLLTVALVFSFPVLFTLERGNTLILTIICIIFFVFNYDNDSIIMRELSLICLAIAAAFKLTPAIFGVILLYERRWKESIRCIVYGIGMVLIPFLLLKRNIIENLVQLQFNVGENLRVYSDAEGCGLVAAFYKYARLIFGDSYSMNNKLHFAIRLVTVLCCLFYLVTGVIIKEKWLRIMGLSLINVILPSHSGTYNAIYLLPVTIMLFNSEDIDNRFSWLFALCFIPLYWMHYDIVSKYFGYNFAIVILVVLFCVYSIYRINRLRKKKVTI